MFVYETFNKIFNFQEKYFGQELTLIELYEKTHIRDNRGEFVNTKTKVFVVSVLIVIVSLRLFIRINNMKCN